MKLVVECICDLVDGALRFRLERAPRQSNVNPSPPRVRDLPPCLFFFPQFGSSSRLSGIQHVSILDALGVDFGLHKLPSSLLGAGKAP